ncbi:MAG: response regulator [Deltaproteobacteria bacterium]
MTGGNETILVVDDEELIRNLAKRILEKAGYSILTAGSGKEALEIYQRDRSNISLVILDLIMPEMGGERCLEELLKVDPEVKALTASGFAVQGEAKTFLDLNAKGTLNKPFRMDELLRSVRDALDGAEQRCEEHTHFDTPSKLLPGM